jgi:hypothetical protein
MRSSSRSSPPLRRTERAKGKRTATAVRVTSQAAADSPRHGLSVFPSWITDPDDSRRLTRGSRRGEPTLARVSFRIGLRLSGRFGSGRTSVNADAGVMLPRVFVILTKDVTRRRGIDATLT